MIKNKLKKINILFILYILLSSLLLPISSQANTSKYAGKIKDDTIFSSEYSFTPKFIKNVTTTETYGMTNNSVDGLRNDGKVLSLQTYYIARLTSNSQKGKIWIRYNNVGEYNGHIIDLKITLSDWKYLQTANLSANSKIGGINYPAVAFKKTAIDVQTTHIPSIDSPSWTFTFYEHGTNNVISVKSHITFKDMDGSTVGHNEQIFFNSGFDSAYISKNSILTLDSNHCVNNQESATNDTDTNAWVTCLTSGSQLNFVYTRYWDMIGNKYNDVTKVADPNKRTFYHYLIGSESIAPFEFTTPQKNVDVNSLRGLEEATYTISHFVPGEGSSFYYTNYILTDQIPDCFDVKNISVVDDSKSDRTSWFDISNKSNLITISATSNTLKNANFYNTTFYFNIKISKKPDNKIESWFKGKNSCIVPNTANLKISSPTINSTRTSNLKTNTVDITLIKEFVLPATGSYGDGLFIILGITFVLLSVFLKFSSTKF